jgi:hypothetical protein
VTKKPKPKPKPKPKKKRKVIHWRDKLKMIEWY